MIIERDYDREIEDTIIEYYLDGNTVKETAEFFNKTTGMGKNTVRKTIARFNKSKCTRITNAERINSYGGLDFVKELVRKGFNLKSIGIAIGVSPSGMYTFTNKHHFNWRTDVEHPKMRYNEIPNYKDISEAVEYVEEFCK